MNTALFWMDKHSWFPWVLMFVSVLYVGRDPLMPLYDHMRPVVDMTADVVAREPDALLLQLYGVKRRACRYMGITATVRNGGPSRLAGIQRVDAPATGGSRPVGDANFGVWRVVGTNGGTHLSLHVQYDCDGRYVLVTTGEVAYAR